MGVPNWPEDGSETQPNRYTERATMAETTSASDKELACRYAGYVPRLATAYADLRVRSVTLTSMMFIHANAAYQQGNRRNRAKKKKNFSTVKFLGVRQRLGS